MENKETKKIKFQAGAETMKSELGWQFVTPAISVIKYGNSIRIYGLFAFWQAWASVEW